ncbi:MAG TPA: DUF962 domain-containing protein [Minicystis sp.]|nr:DUF962 domain-containing protein [Minicystis sp.]
MASDKRFATFEEFWPFYVGEHKKKATRQFHFLGTTAAMACVAAGVFGSRKWLLLAPIAGYAPAWVSHFFIEQNRPATFKWPVWSLYADFVMWTKTLAGTMDAEVERVVASAAEAAAAGDGAAAPDKHAKPTPDQTLN